jgi:hypothetical protein
VEEGDYVFRLGLDLTGLANGNEIITVLPAANEIYDAAGNPAHDAIQVDNMDNLTDFTPPFLEIDVDIAGNTVGGTKWVNDATPQLSLTGTDSYSETLELTCEVNGISDHGITTTPPTTPQILASGSSTLITISDPLTDRAYNDNAIRFYLYDENDNLYSGWDPSALTSFGGV